MAHGDRTSQLRPDAGERRKAIHELKTSEQRGKENHISKTPRKIPGAHFHFLRPKPMGAADPGRRSGRPVPALPDDPRYVLVPPCRTAAGSKRPSVEGHRNPAQRAAALAQAPNLAHHGLLAGVDRKSTRLNSSH